MPSDYTQSTDNYYYDNGVDGDQSIRQRMEDIYEENSSQWLQYMYEGDIDTRMYSGDTEAIYSYIGQTYQYYKRNQINFNKLRSIINMVSGYQRKTRKTSVIIPQEPADQMGADQLSASLLWSMQRANTFPLISQAFENSCITGINLMSTWMDWTSDPVNGDIKSSVWAYNSFLMDPYFKKLSLDDCNYIWTRKWVTKDQAKIMLPKREREIDSLSSSGSRDAKFPYQPESLNYQERGLLTLDEFWYRDARKEKMLLDRNTGETHKWRGKKENLDRFLAQYPQVTTINQIIPTVRYAVVINDKVMVDGPNPYNIDKYPFVPFVCYFHPEIPYFPQRIQGMIRNLRDAQWTYNRRMRLNLDQLEAGISRGVKFIEDSLVDPEDAFLSGAGRALAIKKGHSLDEVQELQPPQIPPSWFQEIEKLDSDIMKIAGVNEELMGSADDDKAGILSMLRQGAGLTTLQPIFDNLDQSQKLLAQIYIDLMQNNWEAGKFQRILNDEPDPLIVSKYFSKFDIQIIDGALTPTQQTMEFKQLLEMIQAQILPNSPEVFEILMKTAPLQNKKDLIEAMAKQQQAAAEQQQQQSQLAMEELQAKANLANARAEADRGLGVERISRVEENRALAVERMEEAKKDRELADLNKAKAIKELTEIDLNQIQKAIALLQAIQNMQAGEQQATESEEVGRESVENI